MFGSPLGPAGSGGWGIKSQQWMITQPFGIRPVQGPPRVRGRITTAPYGFTEPSLEELLGFPQKDNVR